MTGRGMLVATAVAVLTLPVGCSDSGSNVWKPTVSTVSDGSTTVTDSSSTVTDGSSTVTGSTAGEAVDVPDPCALVTTDDVAAYIDGVPGEYGGYANLGAATPESDSTCTWTFDQTSQYGNPLADRFSLTVWSGTQYTDSTACESLANEDTVVTLAMVALPGIGECVFAAQATMYVVANNVVVFVQMGGGMDSAAPWQDVSAALARSIVARLGG
jgi:hypothetical protein